MVRALVPPVQRVTSLRHVFSWENGGNSVGVGIHETTVWDSYAMLLMQVSAGEHDATSEEDDLREMRVVAVVLLVMRVSCGEHVAISGEAGHLEANGKNW